MASASTDTGVRSFSLLAVPLVLVLFSACTSGTGAVQVQEPSDQSIGKATVISTPDEVKRPIDAYFPTAQQIVQLAAARQTRVNNCLSDAGIDEKLAYPPDTEIGAFVRTIARDRVTRSFLWGFFDPANAATYGYQHPKTAVTSVSIPPQSKQAQQKCPLTSNDAPDPLTFAFDWALPGSGPEVPSTDRQVLQAVADWSACMRDRGFDYKDPLAPLGAFRKETSPSQKQIRTAVADDACKVKTNLVGKCLAVQIAYDNLYIKQQFVQLSRFRAQFESITRAPSTP